MESTVSQSEHGMENMNSMSNNMPFLPTFVDEAPQRSGDEELIHEVLAMNTLAMQKCHAEMLDEANTILGEVYMKLHNYTASSDPQLIDTLRSTTLNNLGVVECHRGQHRQALSHFEAARQLEEAWNAASPSVALNTCATYNALGMYDKATAAAMETIGMLRASVIQEKIAESGPDDKTDISRIPSLPENGMVIAKSDGNVLWGAAWHNMAVAQINTARKSNDPSEHTNVMVLFHNAMRATQELLGRDHNMTKFVTATYRAVRDALRSHGVFKQHHTLLTAPSRPVDPRDVEDEMTRYLQQSGNKSRRRAKDKFNQDLTITFCGEVTNGTRLKERLDPTPYPGAKDVPFRKTKGKKMPHVLRGMTLSDTLMKAGQLYGNPHPLLCSVPIHCDAAANSPLKDSFIQGQNNSHLWTDSDPRVGEATNKSSIRNNQKHPKQKIMPSRYRERPLNDQQTYWPASKPEASKYPQETFSQQRESPSRRQPQHYASTDHRVQPHSDRGVLNDPRESVKKPPPREVARQTSSGRRPGSPTSQRLLPPLGRGLTEKSAGSNAVVEPAIEAKKNTIPEGSHGAKSRPPAATSTMTSSMRPAYEQIKYILMADPQGGKQPKHSEADDSSAKKSPSTPSVQSNTKSLKPESKRLAEKDDGAKAHRLFDAMWVTASASLGPSATRMVGRPSYFVSSTVDLSKDSVLLPEEVMQMVVESSSSSLGDGPY